MMDFLKRWLQALSRHTPSVPIIVSTQLIRADFEARYALDKGSVFNAEYIKALTSRFLGLMVDGRLIELVRVIIGLVAIHAGIIYLETDRAERLST